MKRQKMQIGNGLAIDVEWYDIVPEPARSIRYEGEIIGWRETQVIIRVKEYSVLRFWKNTGLEVGNTDHARRGFKVDLSALAESLKPAPGVEANIPEIKDET
jgi:hypothetical protein